MEEYRDIPGFESRYQVSNLGNVKSLIRNKLLKPGKNHFGYLVVNINKSPGESPRCYFVHQLVAMAFLGHTPGGHKITVDHINHIRDDNRVENLQLLTNRENVSRGKKLKENKSSQFTGVCHYPDRKFPWMASIQINKKRKNLGYYSTELEAANVYLTALNQIKQSNGC